MFEYTVRTQTIGFHTAKLWFSIRFGSSCGSFFPIKWSFLKQAQTVPLKNLILGKFYLQLSLFNPPPFCALERLHNSFNCFIFHKYVIAFAFLTYCNCAGQKKPDSWGRHSETLNNLGSGNWRGEGWERVEKGEVSLQVTWDQGGRILSQLGGFPSK